MINTEQLFQVLTRSNFEEILVKVRHLKYQQQQQQQQHNNKVFLKIAYALHAHDQKLKVHVQCARWHEIKQVKSIRI